MRPYYADDLVTLYLGDCRDVLPTVEQFDAIVTDPPYPDIEKGFAQTPITFLEKISCRQFVFWSAAESFPLDWTAVHIWHKPNGRSSQQYERIFERNGQRVFRVFRVAAVQSTVSATMSRDVLWDHPTQKPLRLMKWCINLLPKGAAIADPFCGSGTTLLAAKMLGLRAIGIESDERFCQMAAERCCQEMLDFGGAA